MGKDDVRVEAYGAVDELNASLGLCLAHSEHEDLRELGRRIQARLFDLGATLATPDPERRRKSGVPGITADDVAHLEQAIDRLDPELMPLNRFILPGGTPTAAAFHAARTVCRRAERRVVELHRAESVDEDSLRYLNRLSDLLFVMARVENRRGGVSDVEWEGRGR